ncbi:cold-shock protein [Streptomyces sp. NPDC018029]|uniref:cold-shock protein n=1 Tax=Streptomyces sp. NPDC018029 TaxID=3365032 RepID=UPI0037A381BF
MAEGTVRWFDDVRGYGFIVPDRGSRWVYSDRGFDVPVPDDWEVRVERIDIQYNGWATLEPGERVSFDFQLDKGGELRAVKVTQLGVHAPVREVSPRAVADMPVWLGCCIGLLAAACLVAYGMWLVRTL